MNYTKQCFKITAKTNMHVGSGDTNYGIIDKLVQRDVLSNLPMIHSSSLKGALREFFVQMHGEKSDVVNYIFGKESTKKDGKDNQAGNYRFFDAHLLSFPVRSNHQPFFRATSPKAFNNFLELSEQFGQSNADLTELKNFGKEKAYHFSNNATSMYLEDFDITANKYPESDFSFMQKFLGSDGALLSDDYFDRICSDTHLPVIPRNSLENGKSKNLWYEQIVPRQSRFFFFVFAPANPTNHWDKFVETIQQNLIQIGANASIGYGFSSIEKM